jgi:hypothetical protein
MKPLKVPARSPVSPLRPKYKEATNVASLNKNLRQLHGVTAFHDVYIEFVPVATVKQFDDVVQYLKDEKWERTNLHLLTTEEKQVQTVNNPTLGYRVVKSKEDHLNSPKKLDRIVFLDPTKGFQVIMTPSSKSIKMKVIDPKNVAWASKYTTNINNVIHSLDMYQKLTGKKTFLDKPISTTNTTQLLQNKFAVTIKRNNGSHRFFFINDHGAFSYITRSMDILPLGDIAPRIDHADTLLGGDYAGGVFYVRDILYSKGKDVRDLALSKRLAMIYDILVSLKIDTLRMDFTYVQEGDKIFEYPGGKNTGMRTISQADEALKRFYKTRKVLFTKLSNGSLYQMNSPVAVSNNKSHIAAIQSVFKIPMVNRVDTKQYQAEYFKPRKQFLESIKMKVSPLVVGMYNATITTGEPIDLSDIVDAVKAKKFVSENGITVTDFSITYGQFKKAGEYNKSLGKLVLNSNVPADRYARVVFTLDTSSGKSSFSIFRTGTIQFSGSYTGSDAPKKLRDFIAKHYCSIPARAETNFNNLTGTFRIGFDAKIELIHNAFVRKTEEFVLPEFEKYKFHAKYYKDVSDKKHIPELVYIFFINPDKSPAFSLVLSRNGKVQIQGATPDTIETAYGVAKRFTEAMKNNDLLVVVSMNNQNVNLSKAKKTGRATPENKNNKRANSWNNNREGYYVRPDASGKPRFFKIPKVITQASKNVVTKHYKNAGIKVPQGVRNVFSLSEGNASAAATPHFVNNRINTRQEMRYKKENLKTLAHKHNIVIPSGASKKNMIALLKNKLRNVGNDTLVTGRNKNLHLGKRLCINYKPEQLIKFAKELGVTLSPSLTATQMCKEIEKAANAKKNQLRKNVAKAKTVETKANVRIKAKELRLRTEARLTRNQARENLTGVIRGRNVNNALVNSLVNKYEKAIANGHIRKGKTGEYLKRDVKAIRELFVKNVPTSSRAS